MRAVGAFAVALGTFQQLGAADPAVFVGDFFRRRNLDALALLDHADKIGSFDKRIHCAGIQPIIDEEISKEDLNEIIEEIKPKYPEGRIDSFVLSRMGNREEFSTEEMVNAPMSLEDIVCLIYALLVVEEGDRPFFCEWLDKEVHGKNGWSLPLAVFRKKQPNEEVAEKTKELGEK